MNNRENTLIFLREQLQYLKKEHIDDFMRAGRNEEVEEIIQNVKFDVLQKFCKNEELNLKLSEIPEGYHYELALYVSQSEIADHEIFRDYLELIQVLEETGEESAEQIAANMIEKCLCEYNVYELLYGCEVK